MKLYIEMTGHKAVSKAFENVTPEITAALRRVVRVWGARVANDARARVPKKTGELAGTIRDEYSTNGLVAFIRAGYGRMARVRTRAGKRRKHPSASSKAPGAYAGVIEFGSQYHNRQPHHFMFPAADAAEPGFEHDAEAAIEPALEQAIDRAGARPK